MVSRITEQVVTKLRDGASGTTVRRDAPAYAVGSTASSGSGGSNNSTGAPHDALVVLTGGHDRVEEMKEQLRLLGRQCRRITLVLSQSAQGLFSTEELRSLLRPNRLITTSFYPDIDELLDDAQIVYLPIMSLNCAVKASQLVGDTLPTILVAMAILRGIPVVASKSALYWSPASPATAPEAAQCYIDQKLATLCEYGVSVVEIDALAATGKNAIEGAHASNAAAGTSATNHSALSDPTLCAVAAGGECNGCGQCVEQQTDAVQTLIDSGAARIGAKSGVKVENPEIASIIDHTQLKPDTTRESIEKLSEEAKQYGFASVCVNPSYVQLAAKLLNGSDVAVCTVIGFPLGATTPTTKAMETRDAIANGATEIDMVINVGALKSGDDELVRRDIAGVVDAASGQAIVKVILETALLNREEKIKGSLLAKMAGADFVKTSTGFGPGGATVEDIALMRETVGPEMGVKASGGIRDIDKARKMVAAGATRIGASGSVAIATGTSSGSSGY